MMIFCGHISQLKMQELRTLDKNSQQHKSLFIKYQNLLSQYHNYLSLMKLTNNFAKNHQLYRNIDFSKYQGKMALVGNISNFDSGNNLNEYMFPVVTTTVNAHLFGKTKQRETFKALERKLIITKKDYKKKEVLTAFNTLVRNSKKDKNIVYMFLSLKTVLGPDNRLYFSMIQGSQIIQIQKELYNTIIKPMEQSLHFNFGDLQLQYCYQKELKRGHTYPFQDLKPTIQQLQGMSIIGVVRRINIKTAVNANARQKEVVVEVIQESFSSTFDVVGACKIYVRYDSVDQSKFLQYIQTNYLYLFVIQDIVLSDNLMLVFRVSHWKRNIAKMTSTPHMAHQLQDRFEKMKCSQIDILLGTTVIRNYYKYKLIKLDIRFFRLKVLCRLCQGNIKQNGKFYHCNCQNTTPQLQSWAIIGCMDNTGYIKLILQNQPLIDFFGLANEVDDIILKILELNLQSGVTFLNSKSQQPSIHKDDSWTHREHKYFQSLIKRCQEMLVEKQVVAVPKVTIGDLFDRLDEDLKHELHGSFLVQRNVLKNKKVEVFVNGLIENQMVVPQLRAIKVFPLSKK